VGKAWVVPSVLISQAKSDSVFIGLRVVSVLLADVILSSILLDLFAVFVCKRVLRKSQKQ